MKFHKQKNKTCLHSKYALLPALDQKASTVFSQKQEINNLEILKLETIDTNKLDYRVLTKLAEKKKWQHRFRKAYQEEMGPDIDAHYSENIKFIVASEDGRDVGFLRLSDTSFRFSSITNIAAWNICEGYVKPAYQSQGVLRAMIKNAVQQHNVKSMTISTERSIKHNRYYAELGFTHRRYIGDSNCSRLYLTEWAPLVITLLNPCK